VINPKSSVCHQEATCLPDCLSTLLAPGGMPELGPAPGPCRKYQYTKSNIIAGL